MKASLTNASSCGIQAPADDALSGLSFVTGLPMTGLEMNKPVGIGAGEGIEAKELDGR
ncbi:hypothetical protein [Polaromonas sp. CG_9.11]|uniref:hypothetical protein n=1 Tax=Polaromonas sp. CG_9.11 TaxID=2787730 RepID=UPI0018C9A066|nr:hypothetical protein [Polaromonas sp. CG_9.11]MBG6076338.1 hypothetical protein [Polaromonas sp. CG_9.11]